MGQVYEFYAQDRLATLRARGKAGPDKLGAPRAFRRQRYTAVPDAWALALLKAKNIATYRLALYLLRRDWELNQAPIKVSNVAMAELGVHRHRKWEALNELEALGLIRVQRKPKKSPIVTLRTR